MATWLVILSQAILLAQSSVGRGAQQAQASIRPGDICNTHENCVWKLRDTIAECVGADTQPQNTVSSFTIKPSGTCGCFNSYCTVKPSPVQGASPPSTQPTTSSSTETAQRCTTDDECALDYPTGTCHPGTQNIRGPVWVEGPRCRCDTKPGICRLHWYDPIPCKTFKDCWYERTPILHPIRAKHKRKKPITPCKDGEIDSRCVDGYCHLMGWRC